MTITISQVFDRYHKYLQLHDFVQKLNVTLPNLEVVIKDPNEELLLMTSENYTLTIQTNSAILQVFSSFQIFSFCNTFQPFFSTFCYLAEFCD